MIAHFLVGTHSFWHGAEAVGSSSSPYVVQGIFLVAGIIALLAALLNWEWFFNARNTLFIVNALGRRRTRWFYGIIGILLIGMSLLFWYQTSILFSASQQ